MYLRHDHEAFSKPAWLNAQNEMHDHVMQYHVLACRVFVVIRNGMKSVFMCECDLYGRYICYKNMVYICNTCMLCAHHKTRQETSYY